MPDWGNAALLILFGAHLAVFGRLAWRRRQIQYIVASTTFLLLVAVFSMRLWVPEWTIAGFAAHRLLRCAAWASAALGLTLWILRRVRGSAETGDPAS